MNIFTTAYARSYQGLLYVASAFLNFREPKVIQGNGILQEAPTILNELKRKKVLLVTDSSIFKLGLLDPLMQALVKEAFPFAVYSDVVANPTIDNVEAGLSIYKEEKCDCIIAVGGGSSMDCAKMIAARSANPKKSVRKMKGILKVTHKLPLLIAVPTTAGTGSETTVAAVIVDKANNDKYAVNDPKLIPPYAILDSTLLVGLPGKITSTTGMDALTHAVEAYIGHANTKKTKQYARSAVKLIFENLEKSYREPTNLSYRSNMQLASYQAGVAFTRAYVGTVHALAHSLGGFYNVPHGYANAVILPIVLRKYGKKAYKRLAELASLVGVPSEYSQEEKAKWFIKQIDQMNQEMGIINTLKETIKKEDIPALASHAYKEGVPLYPTPKLFTRKQLEEIYNEIIQ